MRPEVWRPPVEPSPAERAVIKAMRRAKLFVVLREHRHEQFDEEFQAELVPLGNGIRVLNSGFSAPFQAAWWYSWMRPPRTGLHIIRRSSRLTTAGTVVATALGLRCFRLWWDDARCNAPRTRQGFGA
jgi:hypothetical protein